MRIKTLALLPLIVLVTSRTLGSGQSVSGSEMDAVAKSVLKITASQCPGSRIATGFIWQGPNNAVTAWHVVVGCKAVVVYYEKAQVSRPAHIVKLRRESDLALLSIDNPPSVPALSEETGTVAANTDLATLGYPLQMENMTSTRLDLRYGGGKLREIVTDSTLQRHISDLGFPSLDLAIAPIEGHLLPGLSGAPIFNKAGHVVAIGDGGLDNGTVGISWGVPVSELRGLASSSESASDRAAQSASPGISAAGLFASEIEARAQGSVTCSGIELTKIRTTPFEQVAASTDDAIALQQILTYFQANPTGYAFDVYQHLPSGATIVLPADATLKPDAKGCTASLSNGEIVIRVDVAIVDSDTDLQPRSVQLELNAVGGHPQGWNRDMPFTYLGPKSRFDGMLVNRKGFVHVNPLLMALNTPVMDRYLFETIASRKRVIINESTLNKVNTAQNNQLAIACRLNPMVAPVCPAINKRTETWILSVLAVQLATFPIG
jgi:S1-C subfamily serine protease